MPCMTQKSLRRFMTEYIALDSDLNFPTKDKKGVIEMS